MKLLQTISYFIFLLLITSCVQKRHLKTVTFRVDMNAIKNVSHVGIRGEFTSNPWNETISLTDENNDGIYEGTFSQETAFNSVQFKFVMNDDTYELIGKDNRVLKFLYKPEILIYDAKFNKQKGKTTVLK